MLNVLVAAALCAAPSVVSSPPTVESKPRWEIFSAFSGGLLLSSRAGAASSRLGVSYQANAVAVPELQVFLGVAPVADVVSTGIRMGARFQLPREGVRPYGYVGFAHNHETPIGNALQAPLPILTGLSEQGVTHRTGGEAGVGIVYDFPKIRAGSLAGRAGLRFTTVALLGGGAPFTTELLGTFGVLF